MSLRLRATARAPISSAVDLRVKWTPSMLMSALSSMSSRDVYGITAQSSPMSGARFWSFLVI
jgi:hypothetical protein